MYFAKVFKNDVGKAVEILSDILLHSKLDPAAITRERDVILREMTEVNKQHEELVLDHLHSTAFQGTGLGRTILGPEQNIQTLTRNDLMEYITTHYTAPRMVIAGAGAINHDELCSLAETHFGDLPTASKGAVELAMDPAVFTGSDIRCVVYTLLNAVSCTLHHPEKFHSHILPQIVFDSTPKIQPILQSHSKVLLGLQNMRFHSC